MALTPGLKHELQFEVTEDLTTDVGGSVTTRVLATPRMIGMMERTAMSAIWDELADGATCVGYEVCVKHVSSAPLGATCIARAKLIEVIEGRKLRFDVEVLFDGRTVGVGTHERRVINVSGFDEFNTAGANGGTA